MARRVLALTFLGLALVVCVALAATESLTNRTGRTATAVTVTFSEEVRITSYDESVFPTKEPSSRSETFRFSGGQLENGARFSVSWTPSTAEISNVEWETTGASAAGSTTGSNVPLTYEEIMAQIAHYPGPDDPLYVPAEGEQIWLTDLEGHADIYDNDSIKINYAPSFDKSQITKIDVYRNGVKMRFVPALFDILTNEQMKTFDGDPAEHTPASSHSDHAIAGYNYSFEFAGSGTPAREASVRSAVVLPFSGTLSLGNDWQSRLGASDQAVRSELAGLHSIGFSRIQLYVHYFMETAHSTEFFPQYEADASVCPDWRLTAREDEIRRMLRAIKDEGIESELGIQLWVTMRSRAVEPQADRGEITPADVDEWFANYTSLCTALARIAEEESVAVLCVGAELSTMQQYTEHWRALVNQLRTVYSGKVTFAEQTCGYLFGWNSRALWDAKESGRFWDAFDLIQMTSWDVPMDRSTDARYSAMTESFVNFWRETIDYYRQTYRSLPVTFGELGVYSYDGAALGVAGDIPDSPPDPNEIRSVDIQEVSDMWGAQLAGARALGVDEATYCFYALSNANRNFNAYMTLDQLPALNTIASSSEQGAAYLQAQASLSDEAPALSSWTGEMLSYPYSMTVNPAAGVEYYCDRCGGTKPLSAATLWTGNGRDVRGIRVVLLETGVAIGVQLGEDDRLGPFEYIVGETDAGDSIHVHIVPMQSMAKVTHSTASTYEEIAVLTGLNFAKGDNWIACFVPYSLVDRYTSRSRLATVLFNFHMAANTETKRELFIFPVSGPAMR